MMAAMRLALKIVLFTGLVIPLLACALHISNSGQMPVPSQPPGTVRVASLNVHYIMLREETGPWSVGDWDRRKGPMDDAFKQIDADIFAFQEMESFAQGSDGSVNLTLDYLLANNPGYAAAAVGDWREFPSTQPILYRTEHFRLLDQGWFFFSRTPDVIYSRTFDGSYPAFASWAEFAPTQGGRPFRVVNVHFEYKSRNNRRLSAELVRERVQPVIDAGTPLLLAGDVNARLGSNTVEILEEAGLDFLPVDGATYHFNRGINLFGAIDHLAVTDNVRPANEPMVLRQRFRGEWPTDHYPVFADIELPR